MFYSYSYPVPKAFKSQDIAPDAAYWDSGLGEFLLPYEAVRTADDPEDMLIEVSTNDLYGSSRHR